MTMATPSRAHLVAVPIRHEDGVVQIHHINPSKSDSDLPPLEAAVDPSSCWDCTGDNTGGHRGLCVACAELDEAPAVRDARLLSPDALAEAAANTLEFGYDDDSDDYVLDISDDEQAALDLLATESIAAASTVDLAAGTLSQLRIADADVSSIDRGNAGGQDWAKIQLSAPHPTGGYTKVMALNSGLVTGFFADFGDQPDESYPFGPAPKTLLHREDGPAMIDYNTGERIPVLRGVVQPAPDDTGFFFANYTRAEDGTLDQTWVSSGGNRVATRKANGDITFTTDGDIDRAGAPAMTVGGVETWWRHDKQIPDPRPAPVSVGPLHGDDMRTTQHVGGKYAVEDAKTVAKKIRADIKAAQYAGLLPDTVDFRVKSGPTGGVRTISIGVQGLAGRARNPLRDEPGQTFFSAEGAEWNDTLQALADQYNYWEEGVSASHTRRLFTANVAFENDQQTR